MKTLQTSKRYMVGRWAARREPALPGKDSGPGLWVPCREEFKQSSKLATRPSALRAETEEGGKVPSGTGCWSGALRSEESARHCGILGGDLSWAPALCHTLLCVLVYTIPPNPHTVLSAGESESPAPGSTVSNNDNKSPRSVPCPHIQPVFTVHLLCAGHW